MCVTLKNKFACKIQEQANPQQKDLEEDAMSLCDSMEDKKEPEEQMVLQTLHLPDYPVDHTGLSGVPDFPASATGLSGNSSVAAATIEEQRWRPSEESCSPVCKSTVSIHSSISWQRAIRIMKRARVK